MSSLIIPILFFIILLVGAIFFGKFVLKKSIEVYVIQHHQAAENILNTGKPPKDWVIKNKYSKNKCLSKLNKVIDYFKTTKLVEDEATRELMIKRLTKVYQEWEDEDWNEMIATMDRAQKE